MTGGVAAGSQSAADAGATILRSGGNAIDAAIAACVVAMCTEPGVMAPGAGGFVALWPASGPPHIIDGASEVPGRGAPTEWRQATRRVLLEYGGGVEQVVGYGSIATPGLFAALSDASKHFGKLSWHRLLEPAIELCEAGFSVSKGSAEYLGTPDHPIFSWHEESRRALRIGEGGRVHCGARMRLPELASSLRALARGGASEFYTGELGRHIADYIQRHGGGLTRQDLAEYEAVRRVPIRVDLDGWSIATNPPPAIGGACLAALLLSLGSPDSAAWTPEIVDRWARVQRAVLEFRATLTAAEPIGAERDDPVLSTRARQLLEEARISPSARLARAPSTIHVSAADDHGNACAITGSAGYGSGVMVPGTGIWMNNALGEVDLHPSGAAQFPEGTRLPSNMAPTVAQHTRGSRLAIGSPGASRITTALAQVLFNHLHLGMPLDRAISHPRLHVEHFENRLTLAHEPELPLREDARALDAFQLRPFPTRHMYFGGVNAVECDLQRRIQAATDDRRGGGTALVS